MWVAKVSINNCKPHATLLYSIGIFFMKIQHDFKL